MEETPRKETALSANTDALAYFSALSRDRQEELKSRAGSLKTQREIREFANEVARYIENNIS